MMCFSWSVQLVSDKQLVKHLQKEVARLEAELRTPEPSGSSASDAILMEKELQIRKVGGGRVPPTGTNPRILFILLKKGKKSEKNTTDGGGWAPICLLKWCADGDGDGGAETPEGPRTVAAGRAAEEIG